ncbi:hypothetical protein B0J11DRAFT_492136 [Dendryphion nanum]|uniref:DUF7779 domain-containing protein n=1 Tax=Dendryphion nanum TaxID=256645 RepID=A0A9P9DIV7_9PLEO|nr:hypothetical protein B0J11DRAFT_492136 [Dendryphion nanum]
MADSARTVSTGAKVFDAISSNHGVVVGDASGHAHIVGSQTTNNHHYPTRPETPPTPSCTLPFRRDPDFVDRGTLLDQIRERCSSPASRVALVGLGGVGKSQLAIEYCYCTADVSPETWVFWVHASNAARLEQGFRDIADRVKLVGRNDPQADVFRLVHNWLRDEKHGKWLLVLDNADDAAVFPPTSKDRSLQANEREGVTCHLSSCLPASKNGSVLVTSRTEAAASHLVEDDDIILIEPMDGAGAQALLQKKLGGKNNENAMAQLAAALEFMPLALVQAAAYIRQRALRCSVQQYLDEFRKSDKRKTVLLEKEGGHHRRDWEAKNSIIITWQISFDHIRSTQPSAADLLSLMSFFDRQGIPEALLRNRDGVKKGCESLEFAHHERDDESWVDDESTSDASIDDRFENDLVTLRHYSFITSTTEPDTFEMHSLVQLATRKWLERRGQLERWKEEFISSMCAEFPMGRYENWKKCQALFPHARLALSQQPKSEESRKELSLLLQNAAWFAKQRGMTDDAERMSTASRTICLQLFGADHELTHRSMNILASAYIDQARWKEAEELMEPFKTKPGTDPYITLTSKGILAVTYRVQGLWGEAEKLATSVMEESEALLGSTHPRTLDYMANLALIYLNQARFQEAAKLSRQVVNERVALLGPEHPDTLTIKANLVVIYTKLRKFEKADETNTEVVKNREIILGPEHKDTLVSKCNSAGIYFGRGRKEEAETLLKEVVETSRRVLGEQHPDTLGGMANLALMYSIQGRLEEAKKLQVQVMEARKTKLGADHPDTLTSMNSLAYILISQGHCSRAVSIMEYCLRSRIRVLGLHHPSTISSLKMLTMLKTWHDGSCRNY